MPDETLNVKLSLKAVPLPPEREEAYWLAIEILVELIESTLNPHPQPFPQMEERI